MMGGTLVKREDRQNEIMELIQQDKCTTVKELCAAIYASDATIRRDLHILEQKGLVRLLYGNIVPLTGKHSELPLAFRENQAKEAKRIIARYAAGMILPNTSVILDSSSSALFMADYINPDHGITVFTNCIKTAIKLHERNVTVYLIGGKMSSKSLLTCSAWTLDTIRQIHAEYLFFSAQSMSGDGYIAGESDYGTQIRRCMIGQAKKQYFLCNAEKVGKTSTFNLCHAGQITGVIANADLSDIPGIRFINVNTGMQEIPDGAEPA